LFGVFIAALVSAHEQGGFIQSSDKMVVDHRLSWIAPAGETFEAAVVLDIKESWHVQAAEPGLDFLIGLALNLTPCVYAMMSVTVYVFGGQQDTNVVRVFLRRSSMCSARFPVCCSACRSRACGRYG